MLPNVFPPMQDMLANTHPPSVTTELVALSILAMLTESALTNSLLDANVIVTLAALLPPPLNNSIPSARPPSTTLSPKLAMLSIFHQKERLALHQLATFSIANLWDLVTLLNALLETMEQFANTPLLSLLLALFLLATVNHVTSVRPFLDAASQLMEALNVLTLQSLVTTEKFALSILATHPLELASTPMFLTPPLALDLALKMEIVST
jgi:hypothetical protein